MANSAGQQHTRTSPTRERLLADSNRRADILRLVQKESMDAALQQLRTAVASPPETRDAALDKALRVLRGLFKWLDPVAEANKLYFSMQEGMIETICSSINSSSTDTYINYYLIALLWSLASSDEVSRIELELGSGDTLSCLWGYLEYEDVQEHATKSSVGTSLVSLLRNLNQGDDQHECLTIVGCFQCLAFNPKCRRWLVEINAPQAIISTLDSSSDLMLRYIGLIGLALITLNSTIAHHLLDMGVHIRVKDFLDSVTPNEIKALDEELGMVWRFIRPFFTLISSKHEEVRRLGAFVLATLSMREVHKRLFKEEELEGELMAMRLATKDERLAEYLRIIEFSLHADAKTSYTPPSLLELCAYRVRSANSRQDTSNTAIDANSARENDLTIVKKLPQHLQDRFFFLVPL